MIGKRQFSLGYLLGEVALFAFALGLTRAAFGLGQLFAERYPDDSRVAGVVFLVLAVAVVSCWGAAIGGLFGKIVDGAFWAPLIAVIIALLAAMT